VKRLCCLYYPLLEHPAGLLPQLQLPAEFCAADAAFARGKIVDNVEGLKRETCNRGTACRT